jgi:nicotinamide riboside kinase
MGGLWVPEYLRTFTAEHGRTPLQSEQEHVLHAQLRQETQTLAVARQQQRSWVFCDTAPLLTAIYSDCIFGDTSLYPEARTLHARYALTLLLEPDIPWVADGPQRDGTAMRERVHARIVRELAASGLAYSQVSGSAEQRQRCAMDAVLQVTP